MSDNTIPWWVTSDPDHPVNAARPVPEAPLMSQQLHAANEAFMASTDGLPAAEPFQSATVPAATLPDHVSEALHVAQTPGISDVDREAAVRVLLTWEAEHKATAAPIGDAHPSTIPDDLIPTEFRPAQDETH